MYLLRMHGDTMFSGEKTAIPKAKKPLTPIRKAQTGAKLQTQFFVPLLFFAMRLQLLRTKKGRAWRSPCEYGGSRMKNSAGENPRHKCVLREALFKFVRLCLCKSA